MILTRLGRTLPALIAAGLIALAGIAPSLAQTVPGALGDTGPETGLPLPRFVSLKAKEANVRRGPSKSHRIDWRFVRRGMPLEVTAEHGHWRRVRDIDGLGGWIHYSLLSGVRTALTQGDLLALHDRPSEAAPVGARLEMGVLARVLECDAGWCRLSVAGHRGWTPDAALWGVRGGETFD